MTHPQQPQTPLAQNRWGTIGVVITSLLLILAILWILSLLQIIDTSWATLLGAVFVIACGLLPVVFEFWPRPSATTPTLPMTASQEKGELEVLVQPAFSGSTVYIDRGSHAIPPHNGRGVPIEERNTMEYIAEDTTLDSGNYTVSINANGPVAP